MPQSRSGEVIGTQGSVNQVRRHMLPVLIGAMCCNASGNISGWMHPSMVPAVKASFNASNAQASAVLSAETVALGVTSLLCASLLRNLRFNNLALIGAMLSICGNMLSAYVQNFEFLLVARVVNGIGLGALIVSSNSAVAALPRPEFAYGLLSTFSTLFGSGINSALLLFARPDRINEITLYMAGATALLIPALWLMPSTSYASIRATVAPEHPRGLSGSGILIIMAVFIFSIGSASVWTFSAVIGHGLGTSAETISRTLASAGIVAVAVSLLVALFGGRLKKSPAIVAGLIAGALSNLALLLTSSPTMFQVCVIANVGGIYFLLPMMLGYAAKIDPSGRVAGVLNGAMLSATAVAPPLAGIIVDRAGFKMLGLLVLATYGVAVILIWILGFRISGKIVGGSPSGAASQTL